jgi:galactan 5-O-arabinofuranosyltransferase
MYFDTRTEPMYVAMFRNDLPGTVGVWPPLGELGGVGLFTIVLLIGLGVAVALGRRTTLVIGATSMMGGAWIFRFFYARMMWETKLVQLYPRTTALILYLLLLLSVYGVALVVERLALRDSLRGPSARIGVACAMLLLLASVGSATADRYMPSAASPPGPGLLSWNAQGAGRNERAEREKRPRAPEALPRPWVRRSL